MTEDNEYPGTAKVEVEVVQDHASLSDTIVLDVGDAIDVTGDVTMRLVDVEPGDLWIRRQQEELGEWHSGAIPNATPLSQAAHLSVEANEALDLIGKVEEYEDGDLVGDADYSDVRRDLEEEVGDVLVTTLTLCEVLGIDAAEALLAVRAKNEDRDWDERTSGGGWRG